MICILIEASRLSLEPSIATHRKIHFVIVGVFAFHEEGMNNPVSKGINGKLWDPQEVFSCQISSSLLVKDGESGVESLNLRLGESCLILNNHDLLLLKIQRGS